MTIKLIYDLGVKLNDSHFGSIDTWNGANEFLEHVRETFDFEETSAGTGMGIRDMQFITGPRNRGLESVIKEMAKDYKIELDYCSSYLEEHSTPFIELRCPKCNEQLDPTEIRERSGTIGDETLYSYDMHFDCMSCPDIMQVVINVPEQFGTHQED